MTWHRTTKTLTCDGTARFVGTNPIPCSGEIVGAETAAAARATARALGWQKLPPGVGDRCTATTCHVRRLRPDRRSAW